ncbi:MAG: hypothetical protein WBL50_20945 [Candidatus Acidiferrum sp.]
MDEKKILARIDELIKRPEKGLDQYSAAAGELYHGTVTVLGLTHGENSQQLKAFNETIEAIKKSKRPFYEISLETINCSLGVLQSLKREVEEGLIGNLRREVTGEVLGDFLQLAQATLDEGTDPSKNVAAVLVAAAFEDTVRRLGALYCGIHTRESLPDILIRLKNADVLKGSQVGVVQSHFQFRNDAMHADWDKIDTVAVRTVLSLVQELLLKHFS